QFDFDRSVAAVTCHGCPDLQLGRTAARRKVFDSHGLIVTANICLHVGERLWQPSIVDSPVGNLAMDDELYWRNRGRLLGGLQITCPRSLKSEIRAAANTRQRRYGLAQLAGQSRTQPRAEFQSLHGSADIPASRLGIESAIQFDALEVIA